MIFCSGTTREKSAKKGPGFFNGLPVLCDCRNSLYISSAVQMVCLTDVVSSTRPNHPPPQLIPRWPEPQNQKLYFPSLILNNINLGAECQAQQRWRLQTQHPQRSFAELVIKNMGALDKGESQRSKLRFICELETRIKTGTKPDGADSPSQLCLSN